MRTKRTIAIELVRHAKTDLLMAYSKDLPGLLVPGRSESEIDKKLPGAIREILEAEGNKNISITVRAEPSDLPAAFTNPKFRADISLDNAG